MATGGREVGTRHAGLRALGRKPQDTSSSCLGRRPVRPARPGGRDECADRGAGRPGSLGGVFSGVWARGGGHGLVTTRPRGPFGPCWLGGPVSAGRREKSDFYYKKGTRTMTEKMAAEGFRATRPRPRPGGAGKVRGGRRPEGAGCAVLDPPRTRQPRGWARPPSPHPGGQGGSPSSSGKLPRLRASPPWPCGYRRPPVCP